MWLSRAIFAVLSAFFLANCAPEEPPEPKDLIKSDNRYADMPVIPDIEDVRFYQRPKLLAKMRSEQAPMPEVVFIGFEFDTAVLGSDSPKFALYEDGKVIYRDGENYRSVKLTAKELSSLRRSLSPAHKSELAGEYDIEWLTDHAPRNSLLLYRGEPVFLSVNGSLEDGQVLSRLPKSVRDAYEIVRTFKHTKSTLWMPEKIEVMIWPYENAPDASILWKPDWPKISDANTMQRGDSYSLYFPASELENLQQFLSTRKSRGAVEIEGRKWSVSTRIPFPQERLWMAPNPEFADPQPDS